MTILEKNTLSYKEGTSDKVYIASLIQEEQGFLVNFEFGKRGTKLQTGTKTLSPVDEVSARKIFDKIVSEKKAKGYQEE